MDFYHILTKVSLNYVPIYDPSFVIGSQSLLLKVHKSIWNKTEKNKPTPRIVCRALSDCVKARQLFIGSIWALRRARTSRWRGQSRARRCERRGPRARWPCAAARAARRSAPLTPWTTALLTGIPCCAPGIEYWYLVMSWF